MFRSISFCFFLLYASSVSAQIGGVIDNISDKQKKAEEILRKVKQVSFPSENFRYDVDLVWYRKELPGDGALASIGVFQENLDGVTVFRDAGSFRKIKNALGVLERIHSAEPDTQENSNRDTTLKKIVFKLFSPQVISGFAVYGEDGVNGEAGRFYITSPVSKNTRRQPAAGRGDGLLDSLLSYDDLNVFSGDINDFYSTVTGEKSQQIMFPPLRSYPSGNFSDKAGSSGKQALPFSAVFISRDVWLLEQFPKSVFYPAGRQILAVDKENFLPLYKIVYNNKNELEKVVIGGWGRVEAGSRNLGFPALVFLMVIDKTGSVMNVMNTKEVLQLDVQ